jgi:hypothetical protein
MSAEELETRLARDGYHLLEGVFSLEEMSEAALALGAALDSEGAGPIRSAGGTVYAARNVVELWPPALAMWRAPLGAVLVRVLGPEFGLVRVLFFDKPPGESWALPWHKDLTISVRDNTRPSEVFRKPTFKAGVPHVEAPLAVLQGMLTARIHLDSADEENGALRVLPGSHLTGVNLALEGEPLTIEASCGDVLLMRPLLAHSSGRSAPETDRHRRVLHLEFSSRPTLPDGYAWHLFAPGAGGTG